MRRALSRDDRAALRAGLRREAGALRDGLRQAPAILARLDGCRSPLLAEIAAADPLDELAAELERTLVESPPATARNGGVIAEGVDEELDRCRALATDSKRHILAMEAEEREKTGIPSLKIRYNKVFGYYLEVTKANQHLVPEHYIRKQTLVNAERYITDELKKYEDKVLGADERRKARELQAAFRAGIVCAPGQVPGKRADQDNQSRKRGGSVHVVSRR